MKKAIIISLIAVGSIISVLGIYTAGDYLIKPKEVQLEEITPTVLEQHFIFTEETKPTPSCHASSIVKFKDTYYTAWFGGTGESKPDVTIWLSSSTDCTNWSVPKDMSEIKNIAHWNPVIFAKEDTMYLFYKIGLHPDDWTTYFRESKDGVEWSKEKLMVEGDKLGRGPVKNKPIELSNGTVLAPASYEYKNGRTSSFVDISTDMHSWKKGNNVGSRLFVEKIQPAIVETEPGVVRMYLRTNRGRIYESVSKNYGKHFGHAKPIGLLNNNSGLDVAINSDGVLGLIHNPNGENWGERSPLIIAFSFDKGKTWTKKVILESEHGEYSYPAIISIGKEFHVTYTYNRNLIRYSKVVL